MSPVARAKQAVAAASERIPRSTQTISALGLVIVTGGAVASLAYEVVLSGSDTALTTLGLIATSGLGGLLTLAGARSGKSGDE